MKNVFEQKRVELSDKRYLMENKTYYAACHTSTANFLVARTYKINF